MMQAPALLDFLTARGVTAESVAGKLRCRPREAITPEVRTAVRKHGRGLLEFLVEQAPRRETGNSTDSHADRGIRRFLAAAVPHPDGSGYFDPAEKDIIQALRELRADREKPKAPAEPRLPGPPPDPYPKPGGGTETFHERAVRLREEWKVKGYPPGIVPNPPVIDT